MTAIGTVLLARSISLRIIPAFFVACLAIPLASAQQQPATEVLEYKGTLAPARLAEVAPRIDGLLLKINFTAGQLVKQGDLLFEFGTRDKELSVALAQASLKQAEAQLRLAEVKLKNAQTLRTRNVASEMQLLEAQAQRDLAAAQADQARANVGLAELALQQMKLYAPMTGIISSSLVNEGAYITKEARDQSRLATMSSWIPSVPSARPLPPCTFNGASYIKASNRVRSRLSSSSCFRTVTSIRTKVGSSLATTSSARQHRPSK
jgi:multidrug efflux pump subunit AcrA (membrane-fusion protein)